jgi:hypothetical protein
MQCLEKFYLGKPASPLDIPDLETSVNLFLFFSADHGDEALSGLTGPSKEALAQR